MWPVCVVVAVMAASLLPSHSVPAKSAYDAQVPYGTKFKTSKLLRRQAPSPDTLSDRHTRGLVYHQPLVYYHPGYNYPVPPTEPSRGYVYKKPPTTTTTTLPPAIEQEQDIDSSFLTPAPPLPSFPEREFESSPVEIDDNEDKWDIRNSIPGSPGEDYPVLGHIPKTSFSCEGRIPGFYGDPETKCQVYHRCSDCMDNVRLYMDSFLCPNGTTFNQEILACDWWSNVDCENTRKFYKINEELNKLGPDGKYLELSGKRSTLPLNQKKLAPRIIPKGERRPLPAIYRSRHKGHDEEDGHSSSSQSRPDPPRSRPTEESILFNEFSKPIASPTSTQNPINTALDNPDYFDPDKGQQKQEPEQDEDYFSNEQVEVRTSIEYDQKLDNDPLNPAAPSMVEPSREAPRTTTAMYPYIQTSPHTTPTTTFKTTRLTTTPRPRSTTSARPRPTTTPRPRPTTPEYQFTETVVPVTTTTPKPESAENLNEVQPLIGLQGQIQDEDDDDASGFIVNQADRYDSNKKYSPRPHSRVKEPDYLPPTQETLSTTYVPPTTKPKLKYFPPGVKQHLSDYGPPRDAYLPPQQEVGTKQALPAPLPVYPGNPFIQAPVPQSVIHPSNFNYLPYNSGQLSSAFNIVASHVPVLNIPQYNQAQPVLTYYNPAVFGDLTALGSSNYGAFVQPKYNTQNVRG